MKIMLFRAGESAQVMTLPGEYPLAEIGELLGGEVLEPLPRLTTRLALCVRADGGGEGAVAVGRNYWQSPEIYQGPCAVVRMDLDGHIWDIKDRDVMTAMGMVWAVKEEVGA